MVYKKAATALGITATIALVVATSSASASELALKPKPKGSTILSAPCGSRPADHDSSSWNYTVAENYTRMRSGTSTSCGILGQAQRSHRLDYHCYTWDGDAYNWTYARNVNTGVQGWIRDDLLTDNGSDIWCPEYD